MVQEAVESAMQAGLNQIRTDMASKNTKITEITETEHRISTMEDEQQEHQVRLQTLKCNVLAVVDKLENLENRSRRNNIHIVGLPETIKAADLHKLCMIDITKELGMVRECMVERAQRLAILQAERKGPRQVTVQYLINGNKAAILQRFCSKYNLKIEGTNLLDICGLFDRAVQEKKTIQ